MRDRIITRLYNQLLAIECVDAPFNANRWFAIMDAIKIIRRLN